MVRRLICDTIYSINKFILYIVSQITFVRISARRFDAQYAAGNAVFMRVCGLFCCAKILAERSAFFDFGATYGVNPPAARHDISPCGIISHNSYYTLFLRAQIASKVHNIACFSRFHALLPKRGQIKPNLITLRYRCRLIACPSLADRIGKLSVVCRHEPREGLTIHKTYHLSVTICKTRPSLEPYRAAIITQVQCANHISRCKAISLDNIPPIRHSFRT